MEDAPKDVEINGASVNIGSMMGDMMPKKTKMRRMKVADARRLLVAEEEDKLIDMPCTAPSRTASSSSTRSTRWPGAPPTARM